MEKLKRRKGEGEEWNKGERQKGRDMEDGRAGREGREKREKNGRRER